MRKESEHAFVFWLDLFFIDQLALRQTFSCLDEFIDKVDVLLALFYSGLEEDESKVEEADRNIECDHAIDKVDRS